MHPKEGIRERKHHMKCHHKENKNSMIKDIQRKEAKKG